MNSAQYGESQFFEAFIRLAQYFSRLKKQQDVGDHLGKFIMTYFPADWIVFVQRDSVNGISIPYSTLPDVEATQRVINDDVRSIIADVLDSGFLASKVILTPVPSMTVLLPIVEEYRTEYVMLIGHKTADPISNELLNIYLAIAGLASTTFERLHNENELNRHRAHLEELVKERTDELAKAKRQNELILHSVKEGICGVDLEGRITFVNPFAVQMLGWAQSELIGRNMHDTIHHTLSSGIAYPAEKCLVYSALKDGATKYATNEEFLRKDGTLFPVEFTIAPILEEDNIIGAVIVFRDITERKQADQEREQLLEQLKERSDELQKTNEELEVKGEELAAQAEEIESANEELRTNNDELQSVTDSLRETGVYLESLINYANAPIIVWDPRFTITRFNHAFERLSGYTANEVIGKHLSILFPPDSSDESLDKINKTLEGEQWESVEIPIQHKYGSIRIALWNSANIYDTEEKLLATIAQGQDITERKQVETELYEAKAQGELYLDLMGHDISNMHQIIKMRLEMAQELIDSNGKLERDDREYIDVPVKTLEKAARLIDNVRKLQKHRSKEYGLESVDLAKVLEEVLHMYSTIPGRDITINYAQNRECVVRANPLLKDIFSNLIDNAVKHSSGPLELGVDIHKVGLNGSTYYRVSIEDNGHGIPDDKKDEVFQRFKRGQTKARGTGLGLYLVKSLVEGFGGYVEVQNRVLRDYTKGTRFSVYLPVAGEKNA